MGQQRRAHEVSGFGCFLYPLEPLLDDDVWEIMLNGPDAIFVCRHQGPIGRLGRASSAGVSGFRCPYLLSPSNGCSCMATSAR
jgi:hypothetical protein